MMYGWYHFGVRSSPNAMENALVYMTTPIKTSAAVVVDDIT